MFVTPFVEKKSLAELQPASARLAGPEAIKRVRTESTVVYSVNPNRVGWDDSAPVGPNTHAEPADPTSGFSATSVFGRIIVECDRIDEDPATKAIVRGYATTEISSAAVARDIVEREKRLGLFLSEVAPVLDDKGKLVGPPQFLKAKEDATKVMGTHFRKLFNDADATWHKKRDHRLINDMDRAAADWLYKTGKIAQPPEWASGLLVQESEECQKCGSPKRRKFPVCPACQWDSVDMCYAGAKAPIGPKFSDNMQQGQRKQ